MSVIRMIILSAILCILQGCAKHSEVHYRVSLTVNDNGKLRTGTGVWGLVARELVGRPVVNGNSGKMMADAVAIDLPGKGLLLVLPYGARLADGDVAANIPEDLFGPRVGATKQDIVADVTKIANLRGAKAQFSCDYQRVRPRPGPGRLLRLSHDACLALAFTDKPDDPSHLRLVDPADPSSMPPGVSVVGGSAQIIGDPVDRQLQARLPWLASEPFKDQYGLYSTGAGEPDMHWYAQFLRRGK